MTEQELISKFPNASASTVRLNLDLKYGPNYNSSSKEVLDFLSGKFIDKPSKRVKKERTRNGGTWTEAQYWQAVRSTLRRGFRWWKPALQALKDVRVPMKGPHGQKWAYMCCDCDKLFLRKKVQIDHIEPCGKLTDLSHLPDFLRKLTPESKYAFAIRCKQCHQKKTNSE